MKGAAKLIDGGGGGQAHFASAWGKNKDGLTDAFNYILEQVIKNWNQLMHSFEGNLNKFD